ncbi:MAG TPA: YbaK/EbsC family protein [Anaerolineales bacterium]|nr:YbaK/EbsC family protein [Anaerolineales bacterium]
MAFKNNVTRLLDSRKVAYALFELDGDKHSAEETAARLGVPEVEVFKTLVILREAPGKKPLLVMAPAGREVELKALAASLGEKKLKPATQVEAERLTGLQTGGISALALLNKGFEICLSEDARALSSIHISAGDRRANLRLAVVDLVTLTRARWVMT